MAHHTKSKEYYSGYKFHLARKNAPGKTAVILRTSFNQIPFNYGIGMSIYPELWEKDTYRPTTNKNLIKKYEKLDPAIKTDLQNIRIRIENVIRDIKKYIQDIEGDRKPFDINELKATLDLSIKKIVKRSKSAIIPLVLPYIEEIIRGMKRGTVLINTGRKKGQRYTLGTIKNYEGFKNQWELFEKKQGRKFRFHEITIDIYNDLLVFFNQKKLSANTTGRHIRNLKVIMQMAYDKGLHENMAFRNKSFSAPEIDSVNIALDKKDLARLEDLKLKDRPHLELALDIFLIGCYTALRYSDYSRLRPIHIKEIATDGQSIQVVDIITKKTGDQVKIPIRPKLARILEKYSYTLPRTYEQKINQYIKDIALEAGINDLIEITKQKGGLEVKTTVAKCDLITTHTARRTGVTQMYLAGIPIQDIMKISGHKTEKSFMKYLKISNEDAAIRMASTEHFKGNSIAKVINL